MHPDAEFLGLEATDAGDFAFEVRNHLARLDGQLYGGTAIAVSMAVAEMLTGRPAVWMTTQFVATAPGGARISVYPEVLAAGHRTSQVRVTGSDSNGNTMFASLGATATPKPDGLTGTFESMPEVASPAGSSAVRSPFVAMAHNAGITDLPPMPEGVGFSEELQFAVPDILQHPDPGPGRFCCWVRRKDGIPITAAMAAFVGDMVPLSVAHGLGVVAGGISLDNSIRVGSFEPTEWVLIDLRPHMATGGYGHGTAHIWSEAGELAATVSQSASMMQFDLASAPWVDD